MDEMKSIEHLKKVADMKGALKLLRMLMVKNRNQHGILLDEEELNMVLEFAGEEPVTSEKAEIKES